MKGMDNNAPHGFFGGGSDSYEQMMLMGGGQQGYGGIPSWMGGTPGGFWNISSWSTNRNSTSVAGAQTGICRRRVPVGVPTTFPSFVGGVQTGFPVPGVGVVAGGVGGYPQGFTVTMATTTVIKVTMAIMDITTKVTMAIMDTITTKVTKVIMDIINNKYIITDTIIYPQAVLYQIHQDHHGHHGHHGHQGQHGHQGHHGHQGQHGHQGHHGHKVNMAIKAIKAITATKVNMVIKVTKANNINNINTNSINSINNNLLLGQVELEQEERGSSRSG